MHRKDKKLARSNQPSQQKRPAKKGSAHSRQDPAVLDRAAEMELRQRDADFDKEIDLHRG